MLKGEVMVNPVEVIPMKFRSSEFVIFLSVMKFRWDILQAVRKFPKRILKIDDAPQRVFTLERTAMTVDYFVKWRIVDEVPFYILFFLEEEKAKPPHPRSIGLAYEFPFPVVHLLHWALHR